MVGLVEAPYRCPVPHRGPGPFGSACLPSVPVRRAFAFVALQEISGWKTYGDGNERQLDDAVQQDQRFRMEIGHVGEDPRIVEAHSPLPE